MSKYLAKTLSGAVLSVLLTVGFACLLSAAEATKEKPAAFVPEYLGEIPAADGVMVIRSRKQAPHEFIISTRDGIYGPAHMWKMTLDPATGDVVSILSRQVLANCMILSEALYEREDGTLFTGAGWLGFNSPYYSTDGGNTWKSAGGGSITGSYSTYAYAEMGGNLYAGTGYWPHHGKLHRWLGNGNWEQVFDYPPPRSTLCAMITFEGKLFFSAGLYWSSNGGWENTVPVYTTMDGVTYAPTAGMPAHNQIGYFFNLDGVLYAWTFSAWGDQDRNVFRWSGQSWEWLGAPVFRMTAPNRMATTDGHAIFGPGKMPGDLCNGVFRSLDAGLTWTRLVTFETEKITDLNLVKNTLYIGTDRGHQKAGIYRLRLTADASVVLDPPSLNLKSNGSWVTCHIELSNGLSAGDINTETTAISAINGAPIPPIVRQGPVCLGDYDNDGVPDLMVKFNRRALCDRLKSLGAADGQVFKVTVSGELTGNGPFEGIAAIKTLNKGK